MKTNEARSVPRIGYAGLLRLLHRALPLHHRWLWLVKRPVRSHRILSVPWGRDTLCFSTLWSAPSSLVNPIFIGPAMNPELRLVRRHATAMPEGAWVDVGANMGAYTLAFRRLTAARIIAYEPLPELFELLEMNVRMNGLRGVVPRARACGESAGTVRMAAGANASIVGPDTPVGGGVEEVGIVSLDADLDVERIGFVKIDVEGFELLVLRGARKTLSAQRPTLFVEVHPASLQSRGQSVAELIDFLRPWYEFEFWDFGEKSGGARWSRLLHRYLPNRGRRLPSEKAFLELAGSNPPPPQIFLWARGLPDVRRQTG